MSRIKLYTGMIGLLATFFLLPVQARITSTDIELVDLGLSVKWASMNIDATATSGAGDFYAWGEVNTKSDYSWETYVYCSGSSATCKNIGSNISGNARYDRAYDYSTRFCLPTAAQWNELISQCTWKETTVDGVKGYNVKGPSGKSIFLPFSGCSYDGGSHGVGSYAYYWTSNNVAGEVSKAQAGYIKSGTKTAVSKINRRTGAAIRAVSNPKYTELVDLGLSVMWASTNIDASNMSEAGGFYAWGEITTKSNYSWDTYTLCSGTAASCKDIGSNISGNIRYDRAYNFSNKLSLPTVEQWNELISQCTWKETTVDGVKGYNVKGPSGKSIFLPFSGCSYDGGSHGTGSNAYYWTSNNVPGEVSKAQAAYIKSGTKTAISKINRRTGTAIRPVATTYSKNKQYALYNYRNDSHFNAWLNIDVDSITYSCVDTLGVEHDDIVVQEVWTPDSLYRIPLEAIDSIGFRAPAPVMASDIFYIRDYHATYTTSIDGRTIQFSNTIHRDSIPKVGQVVLSATEMTPYENGFAGKVVDVQQGSRGVSIVCEEISVGDIYKRLVVVGKVSNDIDAYPSLSRVMRRSSEPWVNIEEGDVIPIDLDQKEFTIGDLLKITSPTPKLTCSYYVYISELYYEGNVKVDLYHPDLTYTLSFTLDQLRNFSEFGKLFAATFSTDEELQKWLEEYKQSKIDKYLKEEEQYEKELSLKWFERSKIKIPIPLPTTSVLNLELELSPLVKAKGKFEVDSEFKTDAGQSMSMTWRGFTPAKILTLGHGFPDIPVVKVSAYQNPFKSARLDLKATGTLAIGFKALLNVNFIHKDLIYLGLACDAALEAGGSINVTVLDTERPEMNLYERLKDTTIKISTYAKGYAEAGTTPYKFLSVSTPKAKLFSIEKIYNILPHFTEPALPKYNNGTWQGKTPLGFFSYPSKDVYIPCKIGMRIVDEEGGFVKEYLDTNRYLDEYDWRNKYVSLDVSDLTRGTNYKCYPTISFFGWKPFNAGPVHNFTAPLHIVASPSELTLSVGSSAFVDFFGGWDTFAAVISGDDTVASIVNDEESDVRHIKILGKKVGTSELKIEDRRTGEIVLVPITVSNGTVNTLQLSTTSITLTTGQQGTVDVTSGSGSYDAVSDRKSVATVTVEGSKVIITAVSPGPATITVKDNKTQERAKIEVTVQAKGIPAEAIDLGLPSGTLWASYNVGATKPEEYGDYYAWGETTPKNEYNWSNYKYCNGSQNTLTKYCTQSTYGYNGFTDNLTILLPEDDAATANWGAPWHMPTDEQLQELTDKCTRVWTTRNNVNGTLVIGPNGNSIFLPAAGWCNETFGYACVGSRGEIWSSSLHSNNYLAYDRLFYSDYWNPSGTHRATGQTVRPVRVKESSYLTCPDDHHPHLIDLGLPSGTKWACCNVGATSPKAFGGYYAWGETKEKSNYTLSNYLLASASSTYNLSPKEDVATVIWGDSWQMPAAYQFVELHNYCSWLWEEVDGIFGARVIGPNHQSIFLPAASFKDDNSASIAAVGTYGSFWGRTHASSSDYSTELIFGTADYKTNYTIGDFYHEMGPTGTRFVGRSVRPVSKVQQALTNDYTVFIVNPSYDNNNYDWWDGTPLSGNNPDNNAEHYNNNFDTYQIVVGLPAGRYQLGLQGFYRKGSYTNDYELWSVGDKDNNNALIYANSSVGSYSKPLVSASSAALNESLGGIAASVGNGSFIPDNMEAAGAWFRAGYYKNYLNVQVGADGKLIIGIKKDVLISGDWTIIDNWTLMKID